MIEIDCPKCGRKYRLDDQYAGRGARCKDCNTGFTVPEPTEAVVASSARAAASVAAGRPASKLSARPAAKAAEEKKAEPEAGMEEADWSNLLAQVESQAVTNTATPPPAAPAATKAKAAPPPSKPAVAPAKTKPTAPAAGKSRPAATGKSAAPAATPEAAALESEVEAEEVADGDDDAGSPIAKETDSPIAGAAPAGRAGASESKKMVIDTPLGIGLAAAAVVGIPIVVHLLAGYGSVAKAVDCVMGGLAGVGGLVGMVMVLIAAFRESVGQGLLSLFVPFYKAYFAFSRAVACRGLLIVAWVWALYAVVMVVMAFASIAKGLAHILQPRDAKPPPRIRRFSA